MIVADEEMQRAATSVVANVFGGYDRDGAGFAKRNAGAVNSGSVSRASHAVSPRVDVGTLLGQHAATLLLVEEYGCAPGKALPLRRLYGCCSITCSNADSISRGLQLRVFPAVEQQQKSVARHLDRLAPAPPAVLIFTRRIVQPVAGEREGFPQSNHRCIAGIIVAIHAEVVTLRLRVRRHGHRDEPSKHEPAAPQLAIHITNIARHSRKKFRY